MRTKERKGEDERRKDGKSQYDKRGDERTLEGKYQGREERLLEMFHVFTRSSVEIGMLPVHSPVSRPPAQEKSNKLTEEKLNR